MKRITAKLALALLLAAAAPAVAKPPAGGVDNGLAQDGAAKPPAGAAAEGAKPAERGAASGGSDFDLAAWWEGLPLSRWIAGSRLPMWAWGLLALIVLLFLRGLLRRDGNRDLDGPPRSERPGPPRG